MIADHRLRLARTRTQGTLLSWRNVASVSARCPHTRHTHHKSPRLHTFVYRHLQSELKMIRTIRFTGFIGGAICGVCLAKVSAKADLDSATVSPMESDELTPTADSAIQIPQLKLKQVQVFFRHGARTPLHLTPGIEEVSCIVLKTYISLCVNFIHKSYAFIIIIIQN